MGTIAIRAEHVAKQYRIGTQAVPYGTLREALSGLARLPSRVGRRGTEELVWALRDVSFEVQTGEVLGIIGRNGAGKSTLLKVLSRITEPTRGRVEVHGRVGSLLEVGTGFHPELTGRDNIFLNGSILGMDRAYIQRRFDEIVEFSGVRQFIDTPVKRYSSGMYLRLAFAVAAHLEPEILILDEVLAVGDAAFQKKCLAKMGDVAREGRTVLFVSHNLTAVTQLCQRAILIADGRVHRDGPSAQVVSEYLREGGENTGERTWPEGAAAPGNERIRLHAVRIVVGGEVTATADIDREVQVQVEFWNHVPGLRNVCANIYLMDSTGVTVLSTATTPGANLLSEEWFGRPHPAGLYRATCTFPANFLNEGTYLVNAYVVTLGPVIVEAQAEQVLAFDVFDTGAMRESGGGMWHGVVRPRLPWRTELLRPLPSSEGGAGEVPLAVAS